jgi:hypothetical protein
MIEEDDRKQRLIDEIARRYNVEIRPDDPAFVYHAFNELAQEKFVQLVQARLRELFLHIAELNSQQREAAKLLAEKAVAGGADYVSKTLLAAVEEFRTTVKTMTAKELAAIGQAREEVRKERQAVEWIAAFATGVFAMLVGALAVFWLRGH